MLDRKIASIVESLGAKLYDIEIVKDDGRDYFRIYITSDSGVDLSVCERISKMVSPMLDVEYSSKNPYFLEVSSPGVERKLKKPQHFELSIGELVRVKTVDGEKIDGKLTGVDGEKIVLEGKIEIRYSDIKSASTLFKW